MVNNGLLVFPFDFTSLAIQRCGTVRTKMNINRIVVDDWSWSRVTVASMFFNQFFWPENFHINADLT